jgi:hypothetical protein
LAADAEPPNDPALDGILDGPATLLIVVWVWSLCEDFGISQRAAATRFG